MTNTSQAPAVDRFVEYNEVYDLKDVVFKAGYHAGLDYTEREDLLQEVVLKSLKHKLVYRSERGSLKNFLYVVAHSTAIDMWRKIRNWQPMDIEDVEQMNDEEHSEDFFDQVLKRENLKMLYKGIIDLEKRFDSKKAYKAFLEVALYGRKEKDVADALNMAEASVAGAKRRGVERLKEIIRSYERQAS